MRGRCGYAEANVIRPKEYYRVICPRDFLRSVGRPLAEGVVGNGIARFQQIQLIDSLLLFRPSYHIDKHCARAIEIGSRSLEL